MLLRKRAEDILDMVEEKNPKGPRFFDGREIYGQYGKIGGLIYPGQVLTMPI